MNAASRAASPLAQAGGCDPKSTPAACPSPSPFMLTITRVPRRALLTTWCSKSGGFSCASVVCGAGRLDGQTASPTSCGFSSLSNRLAQSMRWTSGASSVPKMHAARVMTPLASTSGRDCGWRHPSATGIAAPRGMLLAGRRVDPVRSAALHCACAWRARAPKRAIPTHVPFSRSVPSMVSSVVCWTVHRACRRGRERDAHGPSCHLHRQCVACRVRNPAGDI